MKGASRMKSEKIFNVGTPIIYYLDITSFKVYPAMVVKKSLNMGLIYRLHSFEFVYSCLLMKESEVTENGTIVDDISSEYLFDESADANIRLKKLKKELKKLESKLSFKLTEKGLIP